MRGRGGPAGTGYTRDFYQGPNFNQFPRGRGGRGRGAPRGAPRGRGGRGRGGY